MIRQIENRCSLLLGFFEVGNLVTVLDGFGWFLGCFGGEFIPKKKQTTNCNGAGERGNSKKKKKIRKRRRKGWLR